MQAKRDVMLMCFTVVVIACGGSTLVDSHEASQSTYSESSTARSLEDLQSAIDERVQNLMASGEIPGLSLAVVYGDTEQITKGYGVRRLETEDNVTEDTLFLLASTTKAITASVLLQTMRQNNVSLDTPVKEMLSEFQVAEYYRQQHAKVGDLLAHRMAIPESLSNWLLGAVTTSRLDIVKHALYFKALPYFRESFTYSNLFYQAAGLVTEALSDGQLWETVVRNILFQPLHMDDSSFMDQLTDEQKSRLATPYEPDWRNNNKMREISLEFYKHTGLGAPSCNVVSSAKDLAKWLYLLTHGGRNAAGERVLDEQVVDDVMTPHSLSTPLYSSEPVTLVSETSGYGWLTGFYEGYRMAYHSGYLFGYSSFATVLPRQKIGIFTCINGQQSGGANMWDIHSFILDSLLNQTTSQTGSTTAATMEQRKERKRIQQFTERRKYLQTLLKRASNQHVRQVANEFLEQFVGVYGNFAFGNMSITYNNDTSRLQADYGDLLSIDLFHIGDDWFVGQPSSLVWFFPPADMTFIRRSEDNAVVSVTVPSLLEADPPVFVRGLTMDQAPKPPTCDC